jgi:hypothetical protein
LRIGVEQIEVDVRASHLQLAKSIDIGRQMNVHTKKAVTRQAAYKGAPKLRSSHAPIAARSLFEA